MGEQPVVGLVGPDTDAVAAAVEAAGGDAVAGPATAVAADSDYLVAVGESAVLSVARATPDAPILPVAAGRGVRSVPADAVDAAVAALLDGEWEGIDLPLVSARVGARTAALALQDLLLVSAEPAQISEYAVRADGSPVASFRADGVAVATPAGSSGYARDAGGPVVHPGTDAFVVEPVAPFSTSLDDWVVPAAEIRLTVERDEVAVHLVADERVVGTVSPADDVRLAPVDGVTLAVVAASRSWSASR